MSIKRILPVLMVFILGCVEKEVKTKSPAPPNFLSWTNKFTTKEGKGELFLMMAKTRQGSYFDFKYDANNKRLSGNLIGMFGLKLASFVVEGNSINVMSRNNDPIRLDTLFSGTGLTPLLLSRFLAYDIPVPDSKNVIPVSDGYLFTSGNSNIFFSREWYPVKVVIVTNTGEIVIEYGDFRKVKSIIQPFSVIASQGSKRIEMKLSQINLK